jgi:hypothetical protein
MELQRRCLGYLVGGLLLASLARADVPTLSGFDFLSAGARSGHVQSGTTFEHTFADLTGPAPAGGAVVVLDYAGGLSGPASVTVPAGQWNQDFTLTAPVVGSPTVVTLGGTYAGVHKTTQLTVEPATFSLVSVSPTQGMVGQALTVTVAFAGKVAAGGAQVSLTHAGASGPASVTVPEGQATATFTLTPSTPSGATPASVEATYQGVTKSASYTATAVANGIESLTPKGSSWVSSAPAWLTLTLAQPASGEVMVSLGYSDASLVAPEAPTSVHFAAGERSQDVQIPTLPSKEDAGLRITAGTATESKSAAIKLLHFPRVVSFTVPETLVGGERGTAKVILEGTVCSLTPDSERTLSRPTSSRPEVAGIGGASFESCVGRSVAHYEITTVAVTADTRVTLSVGDMTAVVDKEILVTPPPPPVVSQLSLSPLSLLPGRSATGTVTLTAAAGNEGVRVALSSADGALLNVPADVTVAAGQSSATFVARAAARVTASKAVQVTASMPGGGASKSASVTVYSDAPATIEPVATPQPQPGGPSAPQHGTTAEVTLADLQVPPRWSVGSAKRVPPPFVRVVLSAGAPAAGAVVELSSSLSTVKVPSSVRLGSGQSSVDVGLTFEGAQPGTEVTITAQLGRERRSGTMKLTD